MLNLQKSINKILYVQMILMLLILMIAEFLYKTDLISLVVGSWLSIIGVLPALLLSRRMPKIIGNKVFFAVMSIIEILKWLSIIIVTVVVLKMYPSLKKDAMVIGFAITYFGSYFGVLIFK